MSANLVSTGVTFTTREEWLNAASHALGAHFFPVCLPAKGRKIEARDHYLPKKLACTCGFPFRAKNAIGQCWAPGATADGTVQMFVCPSQHEPVRVLDVLLHEMIHAAVGCEEGHAGEFRRVAKHVGLSGKMTATIAEPGSELHGRLSRIAEQLGPYPHSPLDKGFTLKDPKKKKKGGGWVRLMSTSVEEYRVVVSPKMLQEHGVPLDPWGQEMVPASDDDEGGDDE